MFHSLTLLLAAPQRKLLPSALKATVLTASPSSWLRRGLSMEPVLTGQTRTFLSAQAVARRSLFVPKARAVTASPWESEATGRPWDDRVRYDIAALCLKINRVVEARMWLTAALACNPDNTQAREALRQLPARKEP